MIANALVAGALAGLVALPHCVVMCGPLSASACGSGDRGGAMVRYQLGRLAGYGVLGAVAGLFGHSIGFASSALAGALLRIAIAVALASFAVRLWRSALPPRPSLFRLQARRPTRLISRVFARVPKDPLVWGGLTAILPCGALGSAVVLAAGMRTPSAGAITMVTFGLVSGPALLGFGLLTRWARGAPRPWIARSLSVAFALVAIVFAIQPLQGLAGEEEAAHTCPLHPS